ncbi:outer membrane protein [Bartonella refiksaydamii]|uniref:outer membrane protein n=1 Tax=Bartonella refiksaydamii TaxID=2654951 RepID=UPI0012EC8AF9|nr:outer membrane protein [Bartonella refiksaydamii]
MNIKCLIATSVIALISAPAAQAADVMVPHEMTSHQVIPTVTTPAFSWTGLYLGAQVGNFSSKVEITDSDTKEKVFNGDSTPKPSGFMGGIFAGSNVGLGNGFILGVETDAVWADREDKKTTSAKALEDDDLEYFNESFKDVGITLADEDRFVKGDTGSYEFAYKEKWAGATRIRIGFAAVDRIMPYFAGGIAYAQMQGTSTVTGKKKGEYNKPGKIISGSKDMTTTMVGYTLGGGVDFAMADNVLLRAEYRYSDYGKKKFKNDDAEFNYKTNDFRVGVAYKF